MSFDLEDMNFLLRYLAEIIIGLIVVLLSVLKLLGHRAQTETVKTPLTEPAVSRVEMLECQMEVTTSIRAEFDKLRSEIREDLNLLHSRINEIKTNSMSK